MVNERINQEIVAYTNSWKKYKEKLKFKRKKEGGIFVFLVYFKNKEGIIFVFL